MKLYKCNLVLPAICSLRCCVSEKHVENDRQSIIYGHKDAICTSNLLIIRHEAFKGVWGDVKGCPYREQVVDTESLARVFPQMTEGMAANA
jgi:hypothetical protein